MPVSFRKLAGTALLGAALYWARTATAAEDPAIRAAIADTVLQIGDWKVSRYQLEKQRAKFRASGANPGLAQSEAGWLETFVIRQAITARLQAEGALERGEVRATVERMERHMLSQVDGPLYLRLAEAAPLDDARLAAMHANSGLVVDARIARFPDDATMIQLLGADFETLGAADKNARLTAIAEHEDVLLFEGAQPWPFPPYLEIRDALSGAPLQEWVKIASPDGAVFWCRVRARHARPMAGGVADRAGFRPFAERVLRQELRIQRRARALRTAEFAFSPEVARQALRDTLAAESNPAAAPPNADPARAGEILFRYRWRGESVAVSVTGFLRRRDELMMRPAMRALFDVQRLAEDMVLREFDVDEAKALGVTESVQFVEDRRAFAGAEALVLYEREVLRPKLAPTADEIAQIYRGSGDRFRRATKVSGRLLVLRGDGPAASWLASPDTTPPPAASILSSEPVVMERGKPIPGLELFSRGILEGGDGKYFGPGQRRETDGILMFRREAAVELETVPLEEAAPAIREDMLRERLAAHERALAIEVCRELGVVDRLDLVALGVRGQPNLPWMK